MRAILESVAARAATGWQHAGAKFDFEVFALPGGSVLAPALWVYSVAAGLLKTRQHIVEQRSVSDVPGAERPPCAQDAQTDAAFCVWPRSRCT